MQAWTILSAGEGVTMLRGLFLAYMAVGILTAMAFAFFGATRVVRSSFTLGARILLIPGALALWPYIIFRWLKARRHQ
jgi:hypothetical protein